MCMYMLFNNHVEYLVRFGASHVPGTSRERPPHPTCRVRMLLTNRAAKKPGAARLLTAIRLDRYEKEP